MDPDAGRTAGRIGAAVAVLVVLVTLSAYGAKAYDQFTGKDVVQVGLGSQDRLAQLNGNRHNLWSSAWRAFESEPVGGIGPGTFEFWWSRDGVNGEFVRDVHNIYLEALAETGIVGFALLLAFFAGMLWCAWTGRRDLLRRRSDGLGIQAGLIAVFVVFLFQAGVDWMWESTAITVFALFAIALATVGSSPRRRRGMDATSSVGLLVAAVLAVVVMLPGLASQRQVERSQAAYRAGDTAAALSHADDAIKAESWSATAYGQRALALEAIDQHKAARDAIVIAEQKEPYDWRWPLIASRIYVQLGEPDNAARSFERARQLRPFLPIFGAEKRPYR